ncbi:MAG TPA: ABC transporter ATP-binding protein [Longimicrobiales bacterium]|nr:ABC transporter ATP-binding protein [Longimicrobiales bacterium]
MPLLEVRNLVTSFHTGQGVVRAVRGVSYALEAGEALAIVGESGSGKTVGALSLLRLVPPPGRIEAGEVLLNGRDLLALDERAMRDVRGREIGMVFQDPMTSLNPVLTVGRQLTEATRRHLDLSRAGARDLAVETLELVGIPRPRDRLPDHPHRFSGGQRQRIMIAMALACRPALLVADEPTTALDVTIQAQIVSLIRSLQDRLGMAVLWITHDLALVAGCVDHVAVMYAGRIVEQAPVRDLFGEPRHPYTSGLLRSLPSSGGTRGRRLAAIAGAPPDLHLEAGGCAFAPRCPHAVTRCGQETPPEEAGPDDRSVACFRWRELGREGAVRA